MGRRRHKVVLIGAKGYQRTAEGLQVDCFLWSQIAQLKNIRDYDTIILDLLALGDENSREEVSWEHFCSLLDFHSTMDVLINGGMIIVIGDPRFKINFKQKQEKSKKDSKESKGTAFLSGHAYVHMGTLVQREITKGSIPLIFRDPKTPKYRKLIVKDDQIIGGLAIGPPDAVSDFGILKWAIKKKMSVAKLDSLLTYGQFNLAEVFSTY